jgi:hypothetical protein
VNESFNILIIGFGAACARFWDTPCCQSVMLYASRVVVHDTVCVEPIGQTRLVPYPVPLIVEYGDRNMFDESHRQLFNNSKIPRATKIMARFVGSILSLSEDCQNETGS